MRVRNLNVGVESITLWQAEDEVHLPNDGALRPQFLPLYQKLDEILKRPSLDERLPHLLQPEFLDPDLLEPRMLSDTRESARGVFAQAAKRQTGRARRLFEMVAAQLDDDSDIDDDIRRSLAQLMRG